MLGKGFARGKGKAAVGDVGALRSSAKWRFYYEKMLPRDANGDVKPFRNPGFANSRGLTEEQYCEYIDRLVSRRVDYSNPMNGFDAFFRDFRR